MAGKYSYLLKNIGLMTISNMSSKLLAFLLVPLYTSVLSTEESCSVQCSALGAQRLHSNR